MSVLLSGGSLSGRVNTGALIVNDYRITLEEIEGGRRLTITRGSEIQTIDLATKSQSKILIRVENDYIQISYNDGQTWENLIALDDIAGGVGGFYTPSIDSEGNLSWTASHEDMPVVNTVNIKGKDGYTPVKGKDYFDGKNGYTPQKNVDYFDGKDGDDGGHYAPHVDDEGNLSWIASKGDMPAIQGSNIKGVPGQDGYTPVKGKDYVDGKDGASGVHIGPNKPTDPAVNVWVKPDGKSSQIVTYAPQTLDDAQKDQARSNIGAASKEELSVLSEEIVEQGEAIEGKQPKGDYALKSDIPVEGVQELLFTIETTGEAQIILDELNGEPLALTYAHIAVDATDSAVAQVEVEARGSNQAGYLLNVLIQTSESGKFGGAKIYQEKGWWTFARFASGSKYSYGATYEAGEAHCHGAAVSKNPVIGELTLKNIKLTTKTIIKIWGIRA